MSVAPLVYVMGNIINNTFIPLPIKDNILIICPIIIIITAKTKVGLFMNLLIPDHANIMDKTTQKSWSR